MPRLLLSAFAVAICTLSGSAAFQPAQPVEHWHEIAWPFPRDGWPAGRAFHCAGEPCGGDVELYVRPKAGFCNCDSGVADDDEVDRVTDLDLISELLRCARTRESDPDCRDAGTVAGLRSSDGGRLTACSDRHRCVAALRPAGRGRAGQGRRVRNSACRAGFSGSRFHEAVDDIGARRSLKQSAAVAHRPSCPGKSANGSAQSAPR